MTHDTACAHTADTDQSNVEKAALVEQAWNQQDPIKIAQDLNNLLQAMMQSPKS